MKEIRAGGVTLDLANRASIRAAVDRVEELHGRLDGAFNNGDVIQLPGPVDATTDEDIDEQFTVNFRAHWTAMNAEVALTRKGGGAIVNTSSIGSRRANPGLPNYGAMKLALNSLTETAAVDLAPASIWVNGITPWHRHRNDRRMGSGAPNIIEGMSARTPLGRMGEPREIAEAAAWLLSDRASYVTGAIVPVDSGAGAWKGAALYRNGDSISITSEARYRSRTEAAGRRKEEEGGISHDRSHGQGSRRHRRQPGYRTGGRYPPGSARRKRRGQLLAGRIRVQGIPERFT